MLEEAIILDNVTKHYKTTYGIYEVVEDLSFSVRFGERVAILGTNGSGKTTLLKMLLQMVDLESGSITTKFDEVSGEIAYVPQDYRNALFPWLKVKTNLSLYFEQSNFELIGNRLKYEELFLKAAEDFNFAPDLQKYPYQFSGGEQQLLVMLQALLRNPKLLVADEPFSAIDINKRETVLAYFSRWLNQHQPTLILVSHHLEDALFLADRIIVLSRESKKIRADFKVPFNHPRSVEWRDSVEFKKLVKQVKDSF